MNNEPTLNQETSTTDSDGWDLSTQLIAMYEEIQHLQFEIRETSAQLATDYNSAVNQHRSEMISTLENLRSSYLGKMASYYINEEMND